MIKWENPALISLALEAESRGSCYPGSGDAGECSSSGIGAGADCEPGVSAQRYCKNGTGGDPAPSLD